MTNITYVQAQDRHLFVDRLNIKLTVKSMKTLRKLFNIPRSNLPLKLK